MNNVSTMANRKEELAALAEEAKTRFLAQESAEEIKDFLKANGAYQRDADRIYGQIKRDLRKDFADRAEALFTEGKSEPEVNSALSGQLEDSLLQQAIESGKSSVMRKIQQAVYVLHDRGGNSPEKIVSEINSPLLTADQVKVWLISREINEQQLEESSGSPAKRILGLVLMLVGIVVTVASMNSGGGGVILYGLIIYGFILMITG